MRWCIVLAVRVRNKPGFMWTWRTLDRKAASTCCYAYFYDCVKSAHRAGLRVDMNRTRERARQPEIVPLSKYRVMDHNEKENRRPTKRPPAFYEKTVLSGRRRARTKTG